MATASSLPNGTMPAAQCAAPADASALPSSWANKYRGATVADLDLPPALSTSPDTSVDAALLSASSHDYSHLTVLSPTTRALRGYLPIPRLRTLLETHQLQPSDPVSKAMVRFQRDRGRVYKVVTMETELWEVEGFFEGIGDLGNGEKQDFAVVTDAGRKFVLGVVTRGDLEEFVRRRPA
jgi:CBS domain-containing protein